MLSSDGGQGHKAVDECTRPPQPIRQHGSCLEWCRTSWNKEVEVPVIGDDNLQKFSARFAVNPGVVGFV
jgi:hypothetical protein